MLPDYQGHGPEDQAGKGSAYKWWPNTCLIYQGSRELLLTLIYMGYFDYQFYMGGGKKAPQSNSDIQLLPIVIKLGIIIL